MPTFEVEMGGKRYEVDAPSIEAAVQAYRNREPSLGERVRGTAEQLSKPGPGGRMSTSEQFTTGFMDPFYGVEELSRRTAGDEAFNEKVRQREADIRKRMPPGFSLPRAAGSAVNPINLMAGGRAAQAGSRIVGGALGGTVGAITQPTSGRDYETEKVEQILGGAATGGALGAAGSALAGGSRVLTPYPLSQRRRELVNILREEGIEPTAGQQSGAHGLRYMESHLGELPGAGGATERANERIGEQFTRAALSRAGINADRATDQAIDRGFRDNSARFNHLAAQTEIRGDRQLAQDLHDVQMEYWQQTQPSQRRPYIETTINETADAIVANQGRLDGRTYQQLRSRIARFERETTDTDYRRALGGIRNALDDAMERTLQATNPNLMGEWRNVRNEFRNLLVIERAATGGSAAAKQELLSPAAIRQAIVAQDRRDYARGRGDYNQLARAGEAILTPLPQSGTAPRAATTHPIRSLIGGNIGRALHSDPAQAYLKNQIWGGQVPQAIPRAGPALAPAGGAAVAQPDQDPLAPSNDALSPHSSLLDMFISSANAAEPPKDKALGPHVGPEVVPRGGPRTYTGASGEKIIAPDYGKPDKSAASSRQFAEEMDAFRQGWREWKKTNPFGEQDKNLADAWDRGQAKRTEHQNKK